MRGAGILVAALVLTGCGGDPASPTVFSVIITAPKQTIAIGEPVQLTTTARDVNGVTISGAKFTYSATPIGIVNIDATGRVLGVASGTVNIVATSSGQPSQPFPIIVTPGSIVAVITMQANTFTPTQVTIRAGQAVGFDFPADQHNVIFANQTGKPDDIPVTSSKQIIRTFMVAGTFPYECTLHPGMNGQVIVNP